MLDPFPHKVLAPSIECTKYWHPYYNKTNLYVLFSFLKSYCKGLSYHTPMKWHQLPRESHQYRLVVACPCRQYDSAIRILSYRNVNRVCKSLCCRRLFLVFSFKSVALPPLSLFIYFSTKSPEQLNSTYNTKGFHTNVHPMISSVWHNIDLVPQAWKLFFSLRKFGSKFRIRLFETVRLGLRGVEKQGHMALPSRAQCSLLSQEQPLTHVGCSCQPVPPGVAPGVGSSIVEIKPLTSYLLVQ